MSQFPDPNSPPPPGYVPPAADLPPLSFATPPTGAYGGMATTPDDRSMGMLCYILGIVSGWLGPLIIWLVKKDTSAFVNDQGKEVLNWELTLLIIHLCAVFTFCIPFGAIVGIICILAASVTNIVVCILGAIEANKGVAYRMPFSIKFIK